MIRFFASDNNAPAHPSVVQSIANMSLDHVKSYGDDPLTSQAVGIIRNLFAAPVLAHQELAERALKAADRNPYFHRQASVCFVYTGTAANIVAIASLLHPGQSVACGYHAHINEDEGGAIEASTGIKLRLVDSFNGKLRIEDVEPLVHEIGNVHRSQPSMISITQTTELGTMYEPVEIRELADWAHEHGMFLHMDGARIANAVAVHLAREYPNWQDFSVSRLTSLAESILRAHTVEAGVDVLSLGGTKNGLMFGEGVVFFVDPDKLGVTEKGLPSLDLYLSMAGRQAPFVRKHHMQLASKMRYISVQMQTLYGSDLWIRNALNANAMGQRLAAGLAEIAAKQGFADGSSEGATLPRVAYPNPANALFVQLPQEVIAPMQDKHYFYVSDVPKGIVRLMTSWDTTEADINGFLESLSGLMKQ